MVRSGYCNDARSIRGQQVPHGKSLRMVKLKLSPVTLLTAHDDIVVGAEVTRLLEWCLNI